MRTKTIILLLAILFSGALSAQQKWTLEQCIDTALANNRNVKQQRIVRKSKEIDLSQSKTDRLPNLNASAGHSFNFGRSRTRDDVVDDVNSQNTSFSASSNLTLFNGLRMKNTIDARKAELLAAGEDLRKVERDIIMNVTAVFLQIIQNKELLANTENQLFITRENIARRSELIRSGKMAEGEIYELQAQEAKEELARVQADNDLMLALLDLAQVLELEDFEGIDVVAPDDLMENELSLLSATEVYSSALQTRPEIKSAEHRLQSGLKNIEIAKSGFMPSLSLGAQWGTGYYYMGGASSSFKDQFSKNMSTVLGLNLNIPIFNRFEVKNRVKSAELTVESSRLEIENTKLEMRKSIQQAYHSALAAKKRWETSAKTVKANEESYRFASQKLDAGRANPYELNLAKTNLAQSISEQTQAKYEYVFRMKILELMK